MCMQTWKYQLILLLFPKTNQLIYSMRNKIKQWLKVQYDTYSCLFHMISYQKIYYENRPHSAFVF